MSESVTDDGVPEGQPVEIEPRGFSALWDCPSCNARSHHHAERCRLCGWRRGELRDSETGEPIDVDEVSMRLL